jgi:hypothetical protein
LLLIARLFLLIPADGAATSILLSSAQNVCDNLIALCIVCLLLVCY